jgi:hypothetical protein
MTGPPIAEKNRFTPVGAHTSVGNALDAEIREHVPNISGQIEMNMTGPGL